MCQGRVKSFSMWKNWQPNETKRSETRQHNTTQDKTTQDMPSIDTIMLCTTFHKHAATKMITEIRKYTETQIILRRQNVLLDYRPSLAIS